MQVRLDGDWEHLAETVWDGKAEGEITLTLYQTTGRKLRNVTRVQVFCWLPEVAYEMNLVFPTLDWSEVLDIIGRLDESSDVVGDLLGKALTDLLGEEAVARLAMEAPAEK